MEKLSKRLEEVEKGKGKIKNVWEVEKWIMGT